MPAKKTVRKAREDLRRGKRPSTAAGEFVREEFDHIRQGKHGASSTKQAIGRGRAGRHARPAVRPCWRTRRVRAYGRGGTAGCGRADSGVAHSMVGPVMGPEMLQGGIRSKEGRSGPYLWKNAPR